MDLPVDNLLDIIFIYCYYARRVRLEFDSPILHLSEPCFSTDGPTDR